MKRILLLLITILIILCSCELMVDAPPKQGKVHILVYGNDYSDITGARILKGTVNDAVQVGRALSGLCKLTKREYDATFIFGSCVGGSVPYDILHYDGLIIGDGIEATISHNVTRDSLEGALEGLKSTSCKDDMTFIYLCGHGANSSEKKVNYGEDVTNDCFFLTEDALSEYSPISISTILAKISDIPGTKIVLSDFCFSGSLVNASYVSVTGLEYKSISPSELFSMRDRINIDPSMFSLSASFYYETSVEHGLHGDFTTALLKALGWSETSGIIQNAGARKDDKITFFDVAEYTKDYGKYSYEQHPIYSGGSNDIVLFSF